MIIAKVDNIKKLRTEMGLSKKQLSEKAGLPNNAISRLENERSKSIHPIRAKAIAEAMGCSFEEIFTKQ